jgi:hypothetical protein
VSEFALVEAREELIRAVLHRVANERRDDPHAHFDAQLEYDDDRIDDAVRKYFAARVDLANSRSES